MEIRRSQTRLFVVRNQMRPGSDLAQGTVFVMLEDGAESKILLIFCLLLITAMDADETYRIPLPTVVSFEFPRNFQLIMKLLQFVFSLLAVYGLWTNRKCLLVPLVAGLLFRIAFLVVGLFFQATSRLSSFLLPFSNLTSLSRS